MDEFMNLAETSGGGSTRLTWRQRLSHLGSSQTARWWAAALISQYLLTCLLLTRVPACSQYKFDQPLLHLALAPLPVCLMGSIVWWALCFSLCVSLMLGRSAETLAVAKLFTEAGQSIEGALILLLLVLPLVMTVMAGVFFFMEKLRGFVPWRRLKWVALFLLVTSLNVHFTVAMCEGMSA
ncbi:MAG: hypothetical protein ABW123_05760 [Cystobacter sp.]